MEYTVNNKGKIIKIFTPKDLSEYTGYSETWIRERIKRGELPCSINDKPPYKFTTTDIYIFLNNRPDYYDKIKAKEEECII